MALDALQTMQDWAWSGPPEPFAVSDLEKGCGDPLIEQRGVSAWRAWLLSNVGGRDLGIVRACNVGGPSEHKTGRAFDWGVSAADPSEKALADGVLDALLAPDAQGQQAALFRRLGLMYVIWNTQVWSVRTKTWQPYTGTSPHTDHVHFSFGWPGAKAQTSFFGALGVAADYSRLGKPDPPVWAIALGVLGGAAVGWYASRYVAHRI